MEKPRILDEYDFPDNVSVPDGYYITQEPDLSRRNFLILLEEHNKVVSIVNKLAEQAGIELFE